MEDGTQDDLPAPNRGWLVHLRRVKGWVVAVAGAGAVLSGLVGYYTTYQTMAAGKPTSSHVAAPPAAGPLSIMVLPFANQTGDAQKAYVADALTTTVTADLSRLRDAYIVPVATALAFRDRGLTVQQVGAEAGVRFVLQGSVLSSGEKVRVTAQLSDTQSGAMVWNDSMEGDMGDLFALQDRITTGIGNGIRREMLVRAARESETRKSSPAAADLLLRAQAESLKPSSMEKFAKMEMLQRQALALEPDNLAVMAALANTLAELADNYRDLLEPALREKKFAEARALAVKGIEADPERSGNYAVLAMYSRFHGDPAGAVRAAERYLALSPKSVGAYVTLAAVMIDQGGDPRRALDLCKQGIALDPVHATDILFGNQGWAYMQLGDYDAAVNSFGKSLEKNPSRTRMRIALVLATTLKGDEAEARALAAALVPDLRGMTLQRYFGLDSGQAEKSPSDDFERKLVAAWRKSGLPE